ncbi:MAG: reductive dehalogenase [Dehalococcoidales bacterium]|nr:reductive dehalogenase [Dehalococcoidales bacterium]
MADRKDMRSVLPTGQRRPRYRMDKLKRVDKPTTKITDAVQRYDEREHAFAHTMKGDYGPVPQREIMRFVPKYPLGAAFARMTMAMAEHLDGEVAPQKAPIPEDPQMLTEHIKSLGYFLKADIVGVCELPEYAVYSHDIMGNPVELNHKYAIILIVDQDYDTMAGSTGDDWISGSQSFIGYSNAALMSCIMADYLRKLGYPSRAHNASGYQVVLPPLLLLAGIGEMSRAGIVLNPYLGTRFKASVVTTDLPLVPDKPVDFGLQEFCEKCLKCSVECVSGAIPKGGKEMYNGYETWHFDSELCAKFRVTNPHGNACGRCIKVCPYNKPKGLTHDFVRWMIRNTPWMDRLIVKMDDVWGYGQPEKKFKWWFDLEDVDGSLVIPKKSQDNGNEPA